MKLILKLFLGLASVLVIAIVVFVAAYAIGYSIAAAPMKELRSSINVGMSRAEVRDIMQQYEDVYDWGSGSVIQISQTSTNIASPITGSWLCITKVHMNDDSVESIDDFFCVD